MSFDKEFTTKWNDFLQNKNQKDLYNLIDFVLINFNNHISIEPHNIINLLENSDESTSLKLYTFEWPDQIFYFLNEELANLNRQLVKLTNGVPQQADKITDDDLNNFRNLFSIVKICLILSKNVKCLDLIINTSLINQFLSSSSYLLKTFESKEGIDIQSYFKYVCFLLIRVHDPNLNWFKKYFNLNQKPKNLNQQQPPQQQQQQQQQQYQRQFYFKFDQSFFSFLFESIKLFGTKTSQEQDEFCLSTLAIHVYGSILNEFTLNNLNSASTNSLTNISSFTPSQNENLLRAITPQIIDFLFKLFYENEDIVGSPPPEALATAADSTKSKTQNNNKQSENVYLNEYYKLINQQPQTFYLSESSSAVTAAVVTRLDELKKKMFYDKKLIVCRCIPLIVNILHSSLPDKRQVDLLLVLDKCMIAFELVKRSDIKLELIKSYLNMLFECSDRAALKIVMVSSRYFTCLLEQVRLTSFISSNIKDLEFLHEFVRFTLSLIKNLLENSQSVKDTFTECNCYNMLHEILKDTNVLDIDISILLTEMINEVTLTSKQLVYTNPEQVLNGLEDLNNCDMAVLLIKLLPYMQPAAQEFSLNNICRLCVVNNRNQLKACKHSLLFNLIDLLNHHNKFNLIAIERIFRTTQILGRCSMSNRELKKLVELLHPKRQFPYGIHILRCFIYWSKHTTSIGLNLGILAVQNENSSQAMTQNENNILSMPTIATGSVDYKAKRTSSISLNQSVLSSMVRTTGTGALSANAQQQAKYFFDFQHSNSGIRVPAVKKWPGYSFTFHCWVKLRSDLELFDKKRRQLYSFYNDSGQGFEAFFTPDCSSLVVSVCTKKEFLSVQLRELDFDSSQSINTTHNSSDQFSLSNNSLNNSANNAANNTTSTSDYWHSIAIVHIPAKNPFSYSQICIYVDGVLKKETDLKIPNFNDAFNHIRVGAVCSRPSTNASYASNMSNSLSAPFGNLKSVFNIAYKGSVTEKSLNVTSIPSGSQDTVWDPSTCLMGQMSSCFVLHDTITDIQARLLYELGPNQYSVNWLDIIELSDFKTKFLFHYDAKCCKDLTCIDLSTNKLCGKFSGLCLSCDNFKESLNSIGSVQIFYPLLNYLSSNLEYCELVTNEWSANAKSSNLNESFSLSLDYRSRNNSKIPRKSSFDDSEIEQNVVALILNLARYLIHNNDIMQDRLQRNNGIALLSFLLQRLPKRFIDINLLRICQEFVNEANSIPDKTLLNSIYEHLIFDFRIWNKADYEIRIGHIQFILTIIKDDKKYFRKKYGIQFFLDIIKTYFGKQNNPTDSSQQINNNNQNQNQIDNNLQANNQINTNMNDEDLRNLRNSFFGIVKYYAQKELKINEINAIISFLSSTRNTLFQNDLLDMLIALIEAPNSNDQLFLLLYEPNVADGLYAMIAQPDLNDLVQRKLLKLIRLLLKTKKVYDKNKTRMRLDDCGGYAGLVSKINSEYSFLQNQQATRVKFNEQLVIDLMENLLLEEVVLLNYDSLWHIVSLLTITSSTPLISDLNILIKTRLKLCEMIIGFLFTNSNSIKLLTKSPAWQDILCQLFCIERKNSLEIKKSSNGLINEMKDSLNVVSNSETKIQINNLQQPMIVVSSASYLDNKMSSSVFTPKNNINRDGLEDRGENYEDEENVNDILSGNEDADEDAHEEEQEEEDDWENLDYKEINTSEHANLLLNENETEKQQQIKPLIHRTKSTTTTTATTTVTAEQEDESLITSTPSPKKNTKKPQLRRYMTEDQTNFNKKLNNRKMSDSTGDLKLTSTLLKNHQNKEYHQQKPKDNLSARKSLINNPNVLNEKKTNNSNISKADSFIYDGMDELSLIHSSKNEKFSTPDVDSNNAQTKSNDDNNKDNKKNLNSKSDNLNDYLNKSESATELCEKVIYLIFRLLWEGINGSNEEAWKERCQIFSSLHRLAKEYNFVKPIEFIELRLLEMCLQRCNADAKKNVSSKEIGSVQENSREIIKLVDYFISKNANISEKLVSMSISLLDQLRAFDQKFSLNSGTSSVSATTAISASASNVPSTIINDLSSSNLNDSRNTSAEFGKSGTNLNTSLQHTNSANNASTVSPATLSTSLINSYGIIHDEWTETGYLGMNILVNVISNSDIEICAQSAAKINTILHNRPIYSCEEACYLLSSVEKVMYERLNQGQEDYYAFLIPIMKCLIQKCYNLLQMNFQVPNIPFNNASPTFYEDFKEYCKTDEWRIFIQKQVNPFREQYLAMTINPCHMNMKIWWNACYESLMLSIHKRNRLLGESKIKFEDSIFNNWKEREKQETIRYQNYLIIMKRNNLTMRKQLHSLLSFLTSERGAWNEGQKDIYWMLSNHETRERMRCKLIENLQFDSHFEASRLRDYSGYSGFYNTDTSSLTVTSSNNNNNNNINNSNNNNNPKLNDDILKNNNNSQDTNDLAQKLQLNKEAINSDIKEDFIGDDEFLVSNSSQSNLHQTKSEQLQPLSRSSSISSSNTISSQMTTATTTSTSAITSSGTIQNSNIKNIPQEHIETYSHLEEKEKLIIKSECELITVTRVLKGRFELTNKYIYFFDTYSSFYYEQTPIINDSNENIQSNTSSNLAAGTSASGLSSNGMMISSGGSNTIMSQTGSYATNSCVGFSCQDFDILNDFKIPLTHLKDVQLRRYNLRRSALEFFLIDMSNFFINFNKNIRNKIYSKIVSMKLPNMQSYLSVRTPADLLKATDYTQKWCNHEMSNFEYLMKLNTIAGRSYNDLSQYPVFPWILKDYTSETLDINDLNVYRDLSKPVGVLNKKFEEYVRLKYELFEDPTGTMRPFHYGTHYSNAANVMHYLIRLEPFTTLHIQLQSDRFDVADRQFHSIGNTWKTIYENPNDVKELIPEFFYLPEFLENMNNFDFGELQITKNKVNNVSLPVWAKSPEHFIYLHRKALESDYVSEHLHEWIDLIFGYKQQGPEAEKAINVFMYCSYEGAIDLDAITDPVARYATEGMISNFGQTPTQLLKEPHAKRKTREQSIRDKIIQGKSIILWHQINNLKAYYVELCDPKKETETLDPVVYISIPRNHIKSFMQQGLSDPLLSISQSGVIGVNGWQAYERSLTNLFSFEKDPSLLSEKTKKSIAGPFDPNYEIDSKLFVLTHDTKLLISGGHWDNSLRVLSLTKYRNICQIYQHSNIVTCLALDYTGTLLVSGSMDTTCMVWQIVQEYGSSVNLDPVPLHILYGHTDCVTSVDISIELDMIISGSLDGTVNIHTIRKGYFVKTLSFQNEKISRFVNLNAKLSNQRHILVYANVIINHILKEFTTSHTNKNVYELFLYSINGKLISQEKLTYPVQDMIIKDDYVILAALVNNSKTFTNSIKTSPGQQGNFVAASKIIFKEIYDLKTIQTMRLKAPITCLFLTREDSHLLVGLKDGKLIVITGERHLK